MKKKKKKKKKKKNLRGGGGGGGGALPPFYGRNILKVCIVHVSNHVQVWTGHEGPRRMRLPNFKTIGT